jgi:hypothetical protein
MRVVDDLPFDPTTWMLAKRRCGMPSTVMSLCMRSSPNRMPNSSRSSRYASASRSVTVAECMDGRALARAVCLSPGCSPAARHPQRRAPGSRGRRPLLPAEVDVHAEPDSRQQEHAPPDSLAELRRDGAGAHVGHRPADAEDRRADHVAALGARGLPRDRPTGQERPDAGAAHQAQADEAHGHREGEHLPHVRVAQEQHVADPVGVDELPPREQEAEAGPEQDTRHAHAGHRSALIAKLTPMAVAMNVPVATRLAGDPEAQPPSPLPDVHPPALFAP